MRVDDKVLENAHSDSDRSLVDELADLYDEGVEREFTVLPGPRILCPSCGIPRSPFEMTLLDVRRLEGSSDPSEEAAVLTLRCSCGCDGACITGFGPSASASDQDLLLALIPA